MSNTSLVERVREHLVSIDSSPDILSPDCYVFLDVLSSRDGVEAREQLYSFLLTVDSFWDAYVCLKGLTGITDDNLASRVIDHAMLVGSHTTQSNAGKFIVNAHSLIDHLGGTGAEEIGSGIDRLSQIQQQYESPELSERYAPLANFDLGAFALHCRLYDRLFQFEKDRGAPSADQVYRALVHRGIDVSNALSLLPEILRARVRSSTEIVSAVNAGASVEELRSIVLAARNCADSVHLIYTGLTEDPRGPRARAALLDFFETAQLFGHLERSFDDEISDLVHLDTTVTLTDETGKVSVVITGLPYGAKTEDDMRYDFFEHLVLLDGMRYTFWAIPAEERDHLVFAQLKEDPRCKNVQFVEPSDGIYQTLTNKANLYGFLQDHNRQVGGGADGIYLHTPATLLVEDILALEDEGIDRVVAQVHERFGGCDLYRIKPLTASGSGGQVVGDDVGGLLRGWNARYGSDAIIQEEVNGTPATVDFLVMDGEYVMSTLRTLRDGREMQGGVIMDKHAGPHPMAEQVARQITTSLPFGTGVYNFDVVIDEHDRWYIVDFALRLPGGLISSCKTHFNYAAALVDALHGYSRESILAAHTRA